MVCIKLDASLHTLFFLIYMEREGVSRLKYPSLLSFTLLFDPAAQFCKKHPGMACVIVSVNQSGGGRGDSHKRVLTLFKSVWSGNEGLTIGSSIAVQCSGDTSTLGGISKVLPYMGSTAVDGGDWEKGGRFDEDC
jgi:hypothetical protein